MPVKWVRRTGSDGIKQITVGPPHGIKQITMFIRENLDASAAAQTKPSNHSPTLRLYAAAPPPSACSTSVGRFI
ncbi:hypothetical protein J6590_083286 [Homalodisca vitripennis]|nr:hypothetical protein J6590_083286 [Homalodisca vitripennis]